MLETMMELHVPLYLMGGAGSARRGGHGSHKPYLQKNDETRGHLENLKEKWLNLWKTRDKLLHRMNRLVWYPALLSHDPSGDGCFQESRFIGRRGLPMSYLYVGAAVPVVLLLLRQILDFLIRKH